MSKLVRLIGRRAVLPRVIFAGLCYLALAGLIISLLGDVNDTAAQPNAGLPASAATAGAGPVAGPAPASTPALPAAGSEPAPPPAPPPSATVQPEAAPRRIGARPTRRATPTPTSSPTAQLTGPQPNARITITDNGIFPKAVAIDSGGTVTWINRGLSVHTATKPPGAPYRLDTGGLAAGQRYTIRLFDPGVYRYTSAPDCLTVSQVDEFDCSGASITVLPPELAVRAGAVSRPPASSTAPPAVTVHITDRGFVPEGVTVHTGGVVTWSNEGTAVHTATSRSPGFRFDTGGLAAHQAGHVTFPAPGVFTYTSAPDCLNGNKSPAFRCAAQFTVTVVR